MFRNPTAHDPRISRPLGDDEPLELLMIASMVHRRLDRASIAEDDIAFALQPTPTVGGS